VIGRITHIDTSGALEERYFVKRALYIDNILYTISDSRMRLNDLNSLKELGDLKL